MKSVALISVTTGGGDLPTPWVLPCPGIIKQTVLLEGEIRLLSESGMLWKCGLTDRTPMQVTLSFSVRYVACSDVVSLVVTDTGRVFAWGTDANETGVMGISGLFVSETPMLVEELAQVDIVQVALGTSHAAALDSKVHLDLGHLYAWGTGTSGQLCGSQYAETRVGPRIVEGARIFTVKKVLCGSESTAICTGGGFVYLFGRFASHGATSQQRTKQPRAPSHFEEIYAADICLGRDYLALVTEVGQVYCFDDCLDLVQLPLVSEAKVQSLGATNEALYGLSMRKERLPCTLHTWTASLYLLDEPWDEAVSLSAANTPLLCLHMHSAHSNSEKPTSAQQISEIISGKLAEITRKLTNFDEIPFEINDSSGEITQNTGTEDDKKRFFAAISQRLQSEQQFQLSKALNQVYSGLFSSVISHLKDCGASIKPRKRLFRLFSAANNAALLQERLKKSRLMAVLGSVKRFSDLQALAELTREKEVKIAKASQEEAVKMLLRVLNRVILSLNFSQKSVFMRKLHSNWRFQYKISTNLSRMVKILGGDWVKTERLAVKMWREAVIMQGMQKWSAGKLVKSLSKVVVRVGWSGLTQWTQRKAMFVRRFVKLVKRRSRENRRAVVGRCFSLWKHIAYQLSLSIQSRIQALQVSFKALSHVLKRVLRKIYAPGFEQIHSFSRDSYRAARLRHPLLFFTSIYEKMYTRAYSWGFNRLVRHNPEEQRQRRRQCIRALARIGNSLTRKVLWDIMDLALSIKQQLTLDFALTLQQAIDRARHRSLACGLEALNWRENRFYDRYAQLQIDEMDLLTSRTTGYYSPEETASFLTKEHSREDTNLPHMDLISKSTLPTRTQKPKISHKSTGSAGVSPSNALNKPPWRAPSRSGNSKLPSKDAQLRRKEYDAALKQRQVQRMLRVESPPPLPKYKGLIDKRPERYVSQYERSADPEPRYYQMERNLSVVVGMRSLTKLVNYQVADAWMALRVWVVRDGFHATLGQGAYITPYQPDPYDSFPDDQVLETSWKTRLAKVGFQRIIKMIERVNSSLQADAFYQLSSTN